MSDAKKLTSPYCDMFGAPIFCKRTLKVVVPANVLKEIHNGTVSFKHGAISTKSRRIYRLLWFNVDHIERGRLVPIKPPVGLSI
ncbi:hypothetical protein J6590_082390 [Homalodisca vitripennis]|nr:hypothetical protein J6590_082390 [Homalodisca vitripennis]